jgi:acyl-coenzyme A thioesterase PaaI-like protein
MHADKIAVRTSKGLKEYTCLGCPLTRNRTAWCFRLCTPDSEGKGRCGRLAPHSLKGNTQLSIEHHNRSLLEAHWEKLEHLYLVAPCNEYYDPGVRISDGEAEVVIPIHKRLFGVAGTVHPSICFTAMADSATLAVNSKVDKTLVVAVNYDIQLNGPIVTSERALIARSRLVGKSGDHYLAESALTDPEGQEFGRGEGAFKESDIALSPDIGYTYNRGKDH